MIKDLCGIAAFSATLAILSVAPSAASVAPLTLNPKPLACHKLQGNGKQVCDEKPGGAKWKNGWWADPTKYEVIDANLATETEIDIPFDGFKSFSGSGVVGLNARKGFRGTLEFPRKKPGVSTSILTGRPVAPFAYSTGGWDTKDGTYECGVNENLGLQYAPTALIGVVASRPRSKKISIQWGLWGAPFRCPTGVPVSNPTMPELPSAALTNRYPVAAFRKGDLLRLPIKANWHYWDESNEGVYEMRLFGSVILRRVHNQIG